MLRSLLTLALFLCLSVNSYALGLGEINVESRLNEKLNAQIDIKSATERDLESLSVNLASNRDYRRAGIDKPNYLNKIKFIINEKGENSSISLVSNEIFREPLIHFLLDVQWFSGRLLREYTIFLDPPVFPNSSITHTNPHQKITKKISGKSLTKTSKTSNKTQSDKVEYDSVSISASSQNTTDSIKVSHEPKLTKTDNVLTYGPTKKNDTLWSVAFNMRPNLSITMDQMMLAIQAENPTAFQQNNINGLMAGYILTVRNLANITKIDALDATKQASMQTKNWKYGTPNQLTKSSVNKISVDNSATSSNKKATNEAESKIATKPILEEKKAKLVLLGKKEFNKMSEKGIDQKLNAKLLLAQEMVESISQENTDLKKRIVNLEGLLKKRLSLIDLKDESLTFMQDKVRKKAITDKIQNQIEETKELNNENTSSLTENNDDQFNDKGFDSKLVDNEKDKIEQASNSTSEQDDKSDIAEGGLSEKTQAKDNESASIKNSVEESSTQVKPIVTKTISPEKIKEASIVDTALGFLTSFISFLSNQLMAVGAVIVLFILWILARIVRKKTDAQPNDEFQESILDENMSVDNFEETKGDANDTEDSIGDSSLLDQETSFLSEFSTSELDSLQNDAEENDPLSEADVFIVYGRYDQAENLLTNYLDSDPDNIDFQVKLLEVFHADSNENKFKQQLDKTKTALVRSGVVLSDSLQWSQIKEFSKSFGLELDDSSEMEQKSSDDMSSIEKADSSTDLSQKEFADDEIDVDDLERQLNEFEAMLSGDFDDDDNDEQLIETSSQTNTSDFDDLDLASINEEDLNGFDLDAEINDLDIDLDELGNEYTLDDGTDELENDEKLDEQLDNDQLNSEASTNDSLDDGINQSIEMDLDALSLDLDSMDLDSMSLDSNDLDSLNLDTLDLDKAEQNESDQSEADATSNHQPQGDISDVDLSLEINDQHGDSANPDNDNKDESIEEDKRDEFADSGEDSSFGLDLDELSLDDDVDTSDSSEQIDSTENENLLDLDDSFNSDDNAIDPVADVIAEDDLSLDIDLDDLSLQLDDSELNHLDNEAQQAENSDNSNLIDESSDESRNDSNDISSEEFSKTPNDDLSLEMDLDDLSMDLDDNADELPLENSQDFDDTTTKLDLDDISDLNDLSHVNDEIKTETKDEIDDISIDIDLDDLAVDLDELSPQESTNIETDLTVDIQDLDALNLNDEVSTDNEVNALDISDIDLDDLNLDDFASDDSLGSDSLSLDKDSQHENEIDTIALDLESLSEDLTDDEQDIDTLGSKLDLARAYIDMGDNKSAKNTLNIVMKSGDEEKQAEAQKLLELLK